MSEELEGTTCGAWPWGQKNPCDGSLTWLGDDDNGNREVWHYSLELQKPIEIFSTMEVGLRDAWTSWTELRGHQFSFAPEKAEDEDENKKASMNITVEWKHYIPPDRPGGSLMAGALANWKNPRVCGHYIQDRVIIKKGDSSCK